FVVQQKMFMPPPADEQQAQQYKMMNVMMIVMGFLFYHVPAGLCVYFIAPSLWGMGERKLLDYGTLGATATPEETPAAAQQAGRDKHRPEAVADKEPRKGLFGRLLEAAEASAAATQTHTRENGKSGNKPGGSKKSRRK